jgi:hypothetical protein
LLLFLVLFTLFISIWISLLCLLIILSFNNWYFTDLCLNTKISCLFFIPEYLNRNFLLSKIITGKCIIFCVKNMKRMINCRSWIWCLIRNYTNFFTIRVNWTIFNMTNKTLWILKSSWLSNLFNIISNIKYSYIRRLGPNYKKITKDINTNNFTFTLREIQTLFNLSI